MPSSEVSSTDITNTPYRHIGLVLAYLPDGRVHQGTFALVGRNDFLTATHIVIDDSARPVQRMDFFLGVDLDRQSGNFYGSTGSRFSGTLDYAPHPVITWTPSTGSLLAYPTEFNQDGAITTLLDSEAPYDLALIGVSQAIGDQVGWLDMNPLITTADNALSIGYPQNATGMMSRVVSSTRSTSDDIFRVSAGELRPGDSGGPLLFAGDVIGIASGGTAQDAVWAALNGRFAELAVETVRNDSLLGGDSADVMSFDFTGAKDDSPQWLQGYDVNERISGGRGNDTLLGASGNDTIDGGEDADLIYADAGDDVLIGGSGNDTIDGGHGSDTVQFATAAAGVRVDLSAKTPAARSLSKDKAAIGMDRLLGIENATGSAYADRLSGDHYANHLIGGSGNDTLSGGKGDDLLSGGVGRDSISAGAGADVVSFARGDSDASSTSADLIGDFQWVDGDQIRLEGISSVKCLVATIAQKNFATALSASASHFAGGANVSLQFIGKNALMLADMDGDRSADLAVILVGLKPGNPMTSYAESGEMFI